MTALRVILAASIVSTGVHYTDNALAIDALPGTEPGGAAGVVIAWFLLTAVGLLGYRLYGQGRYPAAQICLAIYSYTGISSLGHYLAGSDVSVWRHISLAADGLTGSAVLAFVGWSLLSERRRPVTAQ